MGATKDMVFASSLIPGYHDMENTTYAECLAQITQDPWLNDCLLCVDMAVQLLFVQMMEHVPDGTAENESILQYAGARLLNSVLSSLRLMLHGYYQSSAMLMRDIAEVGMLLEYFSFCPDHIEKWWRSDDSSRWKQYQPAKLRKELNKRDGQEKSWRDKVYDLLCKYGTHMNRDSFIMITNDAKQVTPGPFYDARKLRGCLEQLVLCVPYYETAFLRCMRPAYSESFLMRLYPLLHEFGDRCVRARIAPTNHFAIRLEQATGLSIAQDSPTDAEN